MRQCGVIAAPALLALENGVERLEEDHRLARGLAAAIDRFNGLSSPPDDVSTNIVMARVDLTELDAPALAARLEEEGVRVLALSADCLRFVTHLDVGADDVIRLGQALAKVLGTS